MDVEKKYIANYDKYIAGNENSWCPFWTSSVSEGYKRLE